MLTPHLSDHLAFAQHYPIPVTHLATHSCRGDWDTPLQPGDSVSSQELALSRAGGEAVFGAASLSEMLWMQTYSLSLIL